jgi:hypothetical protein
MKTARNQRGSKGGPTPEHAAWVRDHPTVGPSAFPEYPDDEARRGASRGAVANGNPWRAESPDDVPGRGPAAENPGAISADAPRPSAPRRATPPGSAGVPASVAESAVAAARQALATDPELGSRALQVDAEGAGLVVSGRVTSHEERERALSIVAAAQDVAWVEDCMEVAVPLPLEP